MSIRIMKAVWDLRLPASITPKRTSTVKLVLLKLADNANDNGKCWPSIDRMAHETGMSYRSVTRCLRELEDADIIARVGNWSGGKKHNTYWINIDLINELAEPFEREQKTDEQENPFSNRSSGQSDRSSCPNQQGRMTGEPSSNHQRTTNITDIIKNDELCISQLCPDDYEQCHLITEAMIELKEEGYRLCVCKLRKEEWDTCETLLREVYLEDHKDFLLTWLERYGSGFRKEPSLPNIVVENVNGAPWYQWIGTAMN